MKKRLYLLLTALVLLCSMAMPVLAAKEAPVSIAGNTYYDPEEKAFLFYVDNATMQAVRSTVADGMITADAVTVSADPGVALEVYLDGVKQEGISGGNFRQGGEYVVMFAGGAVAQRLFSFTIVPAVCNSVNSYALPMGFEITEATLDGRNVAYDKSYIQFTGEGVYDVRYICVKTNVPYQLSFQTDRTGPTLSLAEVKDGVARGPVDISDGKNAATINVYLDGKQVAYKDVLTQSGEYYIELADEAGNKTTYTFTIMIYFDSSSWLFILIILISAGAVVAYLIYSRKNLRVR